VLRTGRILTLHPWKGTAEELWFLAANVKKHRALSEMAILVRNRADAAPKLVNK
jgi:hypothetical protein